MTSMFVMCYKSRYKSKQTVETWKGTETLKKILTSLTIYLLLEAPICSKCILLLYTDVIPHTIL